jgi:hypothetical protein
MVSAFRRLSVPSPWRSPFLRMQGMRRRWLSRYPHACEAALHWFTAALRAATSTRTARLAARCATGHDTAHRLCRVVHPTASSRPATTHQRHNQQTTEAVVTEVAATSNAQRSLRIRRDQIRRDLVVLEHDPRPQVRGLSIQVTRHDTVLPILQQRDKQISVSLFQHALLAASADGCKSYS